GSSTRVPRVGFVTRDNPQILGRAVASLARNLRTHGRSAEVVVADESPTVAARDANLDVLRGLAGKFGLSIRYAGLEQKRAFATALCACSGVPRERIEYALFGSSGWGAVGGANRNALLLDGVGESLVMLEDDAVCRVAVPPTKEDRLELTAKPGSTEWYF